MQDIQILIEQIVSDIYIQTGGLDELRQQKFLEWLKSHSSILNAALQKHFKAHAPAWVLADTHSHYRDGLSLWFESLPPQSWLWEYQLILDEIKWWRDIEQGSLTRLIQSEMPD